MIVTILYYLLMTILSLFIIIMAIIICITLYFKVTTQLVKRVCTSNVRLDGKTVLVTGGNQGIGLETARDLASRGARVIIASRQEQKSVEAVADIIATTGNNNVEYKLLDLSKFSSVRKFAEEFNKNYDRLDILVNNAGCTEAEVQKTEDGIDRVMQINYFGPFLLTNLLLDKVIASKPSRIVNVGSCLHHFAKLYPDDIERAFGFGHLRQLCNYGNSKLCLLLWTKTLAKKLPEGVTVNCLHPGIIKTNILDKMNKIIKTIIYFIIDLMFKTPKEGAQTTIHVCVAEELENVSGKYFMECKEAKYSRVADDEELALKVWNTSVVMTTKGHNDI